MHSLDVAVRACGTATPGLGYARTGGAHLAARDTRLKLQTNRVPTRAHPKAKRVGGPRRGARGALSALV